MGMRVVVLEPNEFARWLEAQAKPVHSPVEPEAARGAALFAQNGCGACHTLRGTSAHGVIGPDLTYVGSRLSSGAGTSSTGSAQFTLDILGHRRTVPR